MAVNSYTRKLLWHFVCACSCVGDLSVYVKALEDCVLRIPPNSLSKVWNGLLQISLYGLHLSIVQKTNIPPLSFDLGF